MKEPLPVPTVMVVAVTALAAVPLAALAWLSLRPSAAAPLLALGLSISVVVLVAPAVLVATAALRRQRWAERRATLLSTAVQVSHAVGSTLDQMEVFRALYRQVAAVLSVDAFFVAIADPTRTRVSYRFLVDGGTEIDPTERDLEGTIAGACIQREEPILLRDSERDRERLGVPRAAYGTVEERSVVVAPLRVRGQVIGAISAQSAHVNAYDGEDLELIQNIANEAAIAIERAELHERTTRLSQRLVDLHRVGVELVCTSVTSDNLDDILGTPPRTASLAGSNRKRAARVKA